MDALKDSLRSEGAARRAAAKAALSERAAEAVRDRFLAHVPFSGTIAGYWSSGDELSIRPLLEELHSQGHWICLPAVKMFGGEVQFRRWRPGDVLTAGPHGILQPEPGADVVTPSMVLLPLLGFDRRCNPLIDGIGPYARIHAAIRRSDPSTPRGAFAIGIAYSAQRFDAVPLRVLESPLDYVVTEDEVIPRPVPAAWERVLATLFGGFT